MQKLYMLIYGIDVDKGGITRAMLNRASLLKENYNTSIITLDFNIHYEEIKEKLVSMNRMSPDVGLLNPYEYYRNHFSSSGVSLKQKSYYKKKSSFQEKGYSIQDDEFEEKRYIRYFKDGLYQMYKKWDKKGNLSHIDYFNENRCRTYREDFLSNGMLYRKTYFDLSNNKPIQEILFTNDGQWYLNRWYNSENGNVQNIFLRNPKESNLTRFAHNGEFHTYWLEELCKNEMIKPIIICDGPGSAKKLLDTSSDYLYKIFLIHSNHLAAPHTIGSPIKDNLKTILENIEKQDALIILTEKQKKHLQDQFGNHENMHVIPNYIEPNPNETTDRSKNVISIISRLDPIKRIDLAVLAFNKVLSKFNDAVLEIHGIGPDKERIEKLISELGLKSKVFLKGYTSDINKVYSRSTMTLLTSRYEGFSLAIIESMANATPVISFDVLYSPDVIIKDKETGFLVKDGDIDHMAEKMVYLLENPEEAIAMGKRAQDSVLERFGPEKHKQLWIELLNEFK